jgi:hypothetical protein
VRAPTSSVGTGKADKRRDGQRLALSLGKGSTDSPSTDGELVVSKELGPLLDLNALVAVLSNDDTCGGAVRKVSEVLARRRSLNHSAPCRAEGSSARFKKGKLTSNRVSESVSSVGVELSSLILGSNVDLGEAARRASEREMVSFPPISSGS